MVTTYQSREASIFLASAGVDALAIPGDKTVALRKKTRRSCESSMAGTTFSNLAIYLSIV
jgi:hypothetical protein